MVWDKIWEKQSETTVNGIIVTDEHYRLLRKLLEFKLPSAGFVRVLEVGCGSGMRTLALSKDFKEHHLEVTLIDMSSEALLLAKRNSEYNKVEANLALADVFSLPFSTGVFDIVWNGGVNEHFGGEERQLVFNEMARVCKAGGQVVVIVPNASNLFYRAWKKILEMEGRWKYGFEKPYTVCELRRRMRKARLTPKKWGGVEILTSLIYLSEIIPRKKSAVEGKGDLNTAPTPGILRRLFYATEMFLQKGLWFAGRQIGVKGIKQT